MSFFLFLFFLLSLSSLNNGHPHGDLSHRHKRGDEESILNAIGMALGAMSETGTTQKKEDECYFAQKRSTTYETEPRPAHSNVGECGGKLKRMSELLSEPMLYAPSHQCPNYLAMIIYRGHGEYSIDWNDHEQVEAIGKKFICASHEDELGSNWDSTKYYHYKYRKAAGKITVIHGRIIPHCSMPFPFDHHRESVSLKHDLHRIEADEARAILIKKGVLLHPGLPVCSAHNNEAKLILAQELVESTGHNIRPPPIMRDLSKTPPITRDVNPYSDDRGDNDPGYSLHHREVSPPNQNRPPPSKHSPAIKSAYVEFMTSIGLESSIAIKNWFELDERSQRRKSEGLSVATNVIAEFMAPDDPLALIKKAFKNLTPYERTRPAEFVTMMEHVRDAFEYGQSRAERLAALSMISHLTLSEIQKYIPGLSRYYLEDARKYAKRGYYLPKTFHHRIRGDRRKVDRYLQFVTSYKVSLNLPFGTRRVKDLNNKWIEIPNTLRALRAGEIYRLYELDLKQDGEQHLMLPQSTAYKILKICAAERRKSLHGVDMVIADGMEAFDKAESAIESMLKHNWISQSWHDSLRSLMLSSRQYLRTDYIIHGKEYSTISDHCWSHGLSDPEDVRFQVDCAKSSSPWIHSHDRVCQQCETVQVWFGDMRATLEQMLQEHKDDEWIVRQIEMMRRDLYDWETKIMKLKAHQMRVSKADNDRQWIVNDVKEGRKGTAQLTLDFAMRLLPHNPRESTLDWYAQRGMVWHIGHVLTFDQGDFVQHSYVNIFEGDRQDSAAVTAIIRSIFMKLKAKGIHRLYIRSDQAGCYKSSSTIASVNSIANEVGIDVVGWYFSEAQAGKGPCDRYAAIVKGSVRTAADSKIPVLNPDQFFEAVTKRKPYKGISYELVRLEGSGRDKKAKISLLSAALNLSNPLANQFMPPVSSS